MTGGTDKPARPAVAYSSVSNGHLARCTGCGAEWWSVDRSVVSKQAGDHQTCRADMVRIHKRATRRPRR